MRRVLARLKEHWVRHLLAALQVAVGVAVVTAVFVDVVPVLRSGDTSHEADVFSAFYGSGTYPFYQSRSHVLSVDDVAYLESEVDTVVAASVYDNRFLALLRVDGDLFVLRSYTRVSPGFKEVAGVRLVAGRFFDDSDLRGEEPSVVVISSQLAEALFPGRSAIGEMINIRPEPEASRVAGYASSQAVSTEGAPGLDVRVIGVFEHPEGTPAYAGFFADGLREELLLPATGRPSRALAGVTTPGPGSAPADDGVPGRVAPTEERYPELYFRAAEGMGREAAAEVEALLGPVIESRRQALLDTAADQTESLVISPAVSGRPKHPPRSAHRQLDPGCDGDRCADRLRLFDPYDVSRKRRRTRPLDRTRPGARRDPAAHRARDRGRSRGPRRRRRFDRGGSVVSGAVRRPTASPYLRRPA